MARIKINDLPKDMAISKEELKATRGGSLNVLNAIGGDSSISNVDLQNTLQQQQQTIQMLSNVSKLLSDTSMAVVRKIG